MAQFPTIPLLCILMVVLVTAFDEEDAERVSDFMAGLNASVIRDRVEQRWINTLRSLAPGGLNQAD